MPGLIAKLSHFLFRTHCCHCESVMAIGAINQHYSWFNSSSLQEDWLREEIKLRIVVSMLPLKGYWYNGTPVPEVRRVYSRVSVSLVAVCLADSKPESVWRLSVKGAVMDWDIVGRFCGFSAVSSSVGVMFEQGSAKNLPWESQYPCFIAGTAFEGNLDLRCHHRSVYSSKWAWDYNLKAFICGYICA
jgi:hypothetical protein